MTSPGLSFDAVVTLDDMVAFHLRLLASPAMRAGRLRREAMGGLAGLLCAPFGFVAAMWIVGWEDPNAPSFVEMLDDLLHRRRGLLGGAAVLVAVCMIGAMLAQRLLVRYRVRRILRRVLGARPDVDPADPRLAFRTAVVIDDQGMESRSAAGSTLVRWCAVDRWEEVDGRLMVLGNAMDGFCLNSSGAAPAAVEQFRSRLAARLGTSGSRPQRPSAGTS